MCRQRTLLHDSVVETVYEDDIARIFISADITVGGAVAIAVDWTDLEARVSRFA